MVSNRAAGAVSLSLCIEVKFKVQVQGEGQTLAFTSQQVSRLLCCALKTKGR